MANVLACSKCAARGPDNADGPQQDRGVMASPKIAAASNATIRGITPGNSAPPWAAGANSKPAFTSRTMGAPQPITTAATPIQPSRSRANPLLIWQQEHACHGETARAHAEAR